MAKAALMRTESRGGHYREDFPETDQQNWAKAILIKQVNGKMQLTTEVVDPQVKDRQVDMGDRVWG